MMGVMHSTPFNDIANTETSNILFINDLDLKVTDSQIKEFYSTVGPVKSILLITEPSTKASIGEAYVTFENETDARKALDTISFNSTNGRPVKVQSQRQFLKETKQPTLIEIKFNGEKETTIKTTTTETKATLEKQIASAKPQEIKQILGERLYPLIQRVRPELAGKITGMLLELSNPEIINLIYSKDALKKKIDEASEVLKLNKAPVSSSLFRDELDDDSDYYDETW